MTSETTFQGLGNDQKTASRVLQPPGGGSSLGAMSPNGGNMPKKDRNSQINQRRVNERPETGYQARAKEATCDSWNQGMINKQRNMAQDAPFATNVSVISQGQVKAPVEHGRPAAQGQREEAMSGGSQRYHSAATAPAEDDMHMQEYMGEMPRAVEGRVRAKGPVSDFNPINWSAREGEAAPMELEAHENYAPRDPNSVEAPVRMKGKAATHNPLTWEAYSNFDADAETPLHRSRYQGNEGLKKGAYNPITGEDYRGGTPRASPLILGHPGPQEASAAAQ